MVGQTIHQYQFLEKLGAGGMGEIYKAQDTRLNRFVAIKVLPADMSADPDRRRRFLQEAQAASALNHPNIITIHDIISEGNKQYMVMEYVAGKTVHELTPPGGMPAATVLNYGTQIADALAAAHAAGIIHRDLKPANIMVTNAGLVKLLDFGLAKLTGSPLSNSGDSVTLADTPLTAVGSIVGTLNYMSPEQAEGRILDGRSDIFSFGSVLYEMTTSRRAFDGGTGISTLSAVLKDEAQPISVSSPQAPVQLEEIIFRAMRKDPDQRFQSMREVHARLLDLRKQFDSGTLPPTASAMAAPVSQPKPVPANSKTVMYGAIAGLALALAGGGGWWFLHQREPAQSSGGALNQPVQEVLTNDRILEMVKGHVDEQVLISQIKCSQTRFNTSPSEMVRLTNAGVPASVISLMIDPNKEVTPAPTASAPAPSPVAPSASNTPAPPATPIQAAKPVVQEKPAGVSVNVPDGLAVKLTLSADVPSDADEGTIMKFKVSEDVHAAKQLVIAKGAEATGEITQAKKKILGMGGKMTFRLLKVDAVDGAKLSLRSAPTHRPDGDTKRPLDVPGKKKSKDIAAAAGTEFIGYLDGSHSILVTK